MDRTTIVAALWLLPVSLCAQWLNIRTPGIPRSADGEPDLTAATPEHPMASRIYPGCGGPKQILTAST